MSAPNPATATDTELWQRLAEYSIGPKDVALDFPGRLARENRWGRAFTDRVIGEYKRFCYLAVAGDEEVTPSDAVDQVWHLHLTYSREYWDEFCPNVLGAELHHGPTAGGAREKSRFYDQYAATLAAYEEAFGEAPPADIWPDAKRRFVRDPRAFRVNPNDGMVLDQRHAILGAVAWVALGMGIAAILGVII